MDLLFGIGATGMVVVGLILLAVGYLMPGIPKKIGSIVMLLGAVAFLLGGASWAGLLTAPEGASAVQDSAVYDITYTESNAWQTFDDDSNVITWAVQYNTTSNTFVGGTGTIAGNFTLARADALTTDAVATGALGSVAQIAVTGAVAQPIVAENADGSSNFKWIKASGAYAYEDISVLVPAGSENYVLLNVTLNADAVEEMVQYESCDITFTLAGEMFTIHVIVASVAQ
jgi:hypothetical protein